MKSQWVLGGRKVLNFPFPPLFSLSQEHPTPSHRQINQVWVPSLKFPAEHLSGLSVVAEGQPVVSKPMTSWWCLCHPRARGDLVVWEKQVKSAEDHFMAQSYRGALTRSQYSWCTCLDYLDKWTTRYSPTGSSVSSEVAGGKNSIHIFTGTSNVHKNI